MRSARESVKCASAHVQQLEKETGSYNLTRRRSSQHGEHVYNFCEPFDGVLSREVSPCWQ